MLVQTISGVCLCGHDWDSHIHHGAYRTACERWISEIEICLCLDYEDEYEG